MFHSGEVHVPGLRASVRKIMFLALVLIASASIIPEEIMAQGNLLITPRRVVFEGAKKTEELNLANTGNDTATYIVSMIQYRMKMDGSFEEITEPDSGQLFADKYVRFFPRSVTLAPNESQVVKMQLARTSDIPAGEYRSHIYFRAVPKPTALGEKDNNKDTTTLSVKLVPIFGITIPCILRVGETSAKVSISDLSFQILNDTIPRFSLKFNRTGTRSVYGDVDVYHVTADGKSTQVGLIRGISVYTPNPYRILVMDLMRSPIINYREGKLVVTYTSQSELRASKMAEAELPLK